MGAPYLTTKEQGIELTRMLDAGEVPTEKVEEAKAALLDLRSRLETEAEDPAKALERQNQQRLASVSTAINQLADNPVGATLATSQVPRATGIEVPFGPTHDNVLHNQARDRGIDIHTGADWDARFGQGLAHLKDPQLRMNMLDAHYRQPLIEAGVAWPENVPVVMLEEQTGKLAYVRPITEDDLKQGEDPANIGRGRLTLVDPEGLEVGDLAEFLPILPNIAGQTASALAAGALIKSPQAALFASSAASATIEGLSSPLKDKLLRDYYGVTQEELDQFSDPNEALTQALWAGGLEYGAGQAFVLARHLRNSRTKRTLTEEDYDALVAELDAIRALNAEFAEVTGRSIEDPLMFTEAASKKMESTSGQSIGVWSANFFKRLSPKQKATRSTANDVTRLKIKRGFEDITNATAREGDHTVRRDRRRDHEDHPPRGGCGRCCHQYAGDDRGCHPGPRRPAQQRHLVALPGCTGHHGQPVWPGRSQRGAPVGALQELLGAQRYGYRVRYQAGQR
jgi:hypothetical protein